MGNYAENPNVLHSLPSQRDRERKAIIATTRILLNSPFFIRFNKYPYTTVAEQPGPLPPSITGFPSLYMSIPQS